MSGRKTYYQNHSEVRKAYQKEYRLTHKGHKRVKEIPIENSLIEGLLVKDIKAFIPIFNRKPMVREVLDWSEMYGHKQGDTNWARRLIKKALNGTKIEKQIRETSFVLYENRVYEEPTLEQPRLGDLALK